MDLMDMARIPEPERDGPEAAAIYEQCSECGVPVEPNQRYCVNCGSRRRHVSDPADRYLAQARAGSRGAHSTGGSPARPTIGLGGALIIALLPLAIALGIVLGRSSVGGDAQLIAALRAQRPEVVTTSNRGGATTPAAAAGTAARVRAKSERSPHAASRSTDRSHTTTVQKTAPKHPRTSSISTGGSVTKRLQKSTGKSYVNSQQNLPNSISVP